MKLKIKRSERPLITASLIGIGLIGGVAAWKTHRDADPMIELPPALTLPSPNAYDFYAKAGELHETLLKKTPNSKSIDPITDSSIPQELSRLQLAQRYPTARKEAWLRANTPVLSTLRQGFKYPFLLNFDTKTGFTEYSKSRKLARLLVIESHARAERGDWAGASRSALDVIHMGQAIPKGGPYISALVGQSIDSMGVREFESIVPKLDAKSSRAAATRLEQLYVKRVPIAEALQHEKTFGLKSMVATFKDAKWRNNLGNEWDGLEEEEDLGWQKRIQAQLHSKRSLAEAYSSVMDQAIRNSRLPYLKQTPITKPDISPYNNWLPDFVDNNWGTARNDTGLGLLYVSLALRAFKLERGHYPASLTKLTPSYIKEIPADPFGGGEALRYRKTVKSYLLYSIGPDGKDDGGKPINDKTASNAWGRRQIKPDSLGDAVAPYAK
jgi:hypothetical protein